MSQPETTRPTLDPDLPPEIAEGRLALRKAHNILGKAGDRINALCGLLREARATRAADIVPNDWANRVDEVLKNGE